MSSAAFSGAMNDDSDLTSPESNGAPPASSPSVQESPLFAFLRSLSPVKSDKISRYTQRFSMSSFPMPQPIFSSPQVNLHPRISIPKSEDSGLESSGQSGAQSKAEPIHSFWDDVQLSSPSTHIDEFLADPLQTEDTLNAFNQHVVGNGNGNGDGACVTRTSDANVESAASLLPLSEVDRDQSASQASQRNDLQDATGQCSELSEVYQTFALSFPTGVTYGGCAQEPRPMSKGSEKEYEQNHRGIRRNLQFETVMVGKNTSNRIHGMNNDRFPAGLQDSGSTPNFKSLLSGCDEPRGISSSGLADDCAQIVFCRSYSFPSDTSRLAQNYGPASHCWDTESLASKHFIGTMIANEEKIMPDGNQFLANDLHSVSIPSSAGAFTFMGNSLHESGETLVADSINSATDNIQHPCAMQWTQFNLQAAHCENASTSEDLDIVEELNQMSPERNRKRTKHDNETEGCKRCNCKRSKCLKLYCECFAAGLYCVDNCSCENCMNKIEYEDTVLDTRKQIEHRNPLAFAPKVVQHSISSPANTVEEANQTTPSSARHKRGCNCKKSKCVKKYCECYQANVGCSEGCRCECCDNPFGRKAESTYRRIENQENQSHPQPDALMAWKNGTGTGRLHQSSPTWEALADITNLTPASHPRLGAMASAAHTNWTQGSSPYSLPGQHHMQFMPTRFPPKFDGSLLELTSGKLLQDLIKEDDALQTLEHASTPRNAMEVESSNQKCVSPQRGQRSNSSQGLRDGQKLSLQAMPSFPPLSPYRSKSPDGIQQIDDTNDHGLDVTDRNDQMQAIDLCHSD